MDYHHKYNTHGGGAIYTCYVVVLQYNTEELALNE